jgi:eukaryotic-like serine/threonine-protein kinase
MNIIVDGRYQIVKKLGKGGFAHTYLAKNLTVSGEPQCVVKQLRPKVEHPRMLQLFRLEAAILDRFQHHQIPKLLECFEHEGDRFLVQDFVAGDDLTKEFTIGHHWSEAKVIDFLREMLQILAYIHQERVIHRDIKPANIIRRWDCGKLCLIDFGAVLDIANQSTTIDTVVGTPGYQAPEQIEGEATFASDIYGLGMTAIQFITGQYPLHLARNDTQRLVWRDFATVGDRLAVILDRMIRFDVADRYQSTAAVLEDLDALSTEFEEISPVTKIQELNEDPVGGASPFLGNAAGMEHRGFSGRVLAIMLILGLGSIGAMAILQSTQTDPNKAIIEARIDRI